MKERPLPFQPDMALATFEDRKTNTRRVVRNPETYCCLTGDCDHWDKALCAAEMLKHSPYGQPGDRLWVREPWRTYASLDYLMPRSIERGAGIQYEAGGTNLPGDKGKHLFGMGRYRHARFMCRWMSRMTLEVIGVRVERLQDISMNDAIAEGVECELERVTLDGTTTNEGPFGPAALLEFGRLWENINAKRAPWSSNPWVWVIEFKKVTNG